MFFLTLCIARFTSSNRIHARVLLLRVLLLRNRNLLLEHDHQRDDHGGRAEATHNVSPAPRATAAAGWIWGNDRAEPCAGGRRVLCLCPGEHLSACTCGSNERPPPVCFPAGATCCCFLSLSIPPASMLQLCRAPPALAALAPLLPEACPGSGRPNCPPDCPPAFRGRRLTTLSVAVCTHVLDQGASDLLTADKKG